MASPEERHTHSQFPNGTKKQRVNMCPAAHAGLSVSNYWNHLWMKASLLLQAFGTGRLQ